MRTIIKSQVAVLITLLTAFALTLTACGGGSSSSAGGSGGSSLNSATVSGTVASNGVASLEIRDSSGLIAAVSDFLVPAAQADDANQVSVTCGVVTKTDDVFNGQFSVQFESGELGGPQECTVEVDGVPAQNKIQVVPGSTTTVRVVYDDGQADVVFSSGPINNGGNLGIAAGDVNSSDDDSIASADDDSISSADDDSDLDSLDDESVDSNDDDSDSPSDDDSDSKSPV